MFYSVYGSKGADRQQNRKIWQSSNAWKPAFKNMTNDVNITASEELALMLE